MNNQRTSTTKPVSNGLARELGRMVEDAARKYSGGNIKAELAKGHPDLIKRTYQLWDNLAAEQALRLPIIRRPAWKTIELGIQSNVDGYREALKQNGFRISDKANDIMGKLIVMNQSYTVDLVFVTVAELGFPAGATREDIYKRALSLGLSLCPPEVGPALRLAYPDQSSASWVLVGTNLITDSYDPYVFNISHIDGDCWLDISPGGPDDHWSGFSHWVFCRRK